MLNRPIALSLDTLLTALRWAGHTKPHPVLSGGERYIPTTASTHIHRAAFDELSRHGLIQHERLHDDFEHTLHILNQPDTECFAHLRGPQGHYGILAATQNQTTVTAIHHGHVWLTPTREHSPSAALVRQLPPYPIPQFTPYSLPLKEFRDFRRNPNRSGPATPQTRLARKLAEIMDQDRAGFGHLHNEHRTKNKPDSTRSSLSYVDSEIGRVGIEVSGPANNKHLNVFPGTAPALAHRLGNQLA